MTQVVYIHYDDKNKDFYYTLIITIIIIFIISLIIIYITLIYVNLFDLLFPNSDSRYKNVFHKNFRQLNNKIIIIK